MADKKISQLPNSSALTGEELVPIVQGGVTAQTTVSNFGAAVGYLPAGTGAVPTTVQTKLRESVSVKDFGAVGNGVTDDTAAIQAAKTYAEANSRALIFPDGIFPCSTDLVLNAGTTIRGTGAATTTIKMTGSAKIISNRGAATDFVDIRDFKLLQGGTAVTGLDIGTLRRGVVQNIYVIGFKIGVSLDIGVSLVANYWNRLINVTADCTGKTASGSIGFLFGNSTNITYPDTDYNDLFGCKSFNCETAISMVNAVGCKVVGHQATAVGTALVLAAGRNNQVQLVAENCTNMGTAATGTYGNNLDLYNDGAIATKFVDDGWNQLTGSILALQILPNALKTLDSTIQDRINSAVVALSTSIFQVNMTANEGAITVTLTCAGYTQATAEFGGVQVWDVIRTGNGTPVATLIRSTGTNQFTVTTNSSGTCTWVIAGHATNLTVANTAVNIQGVGTPQISPYFSVCNYTRLV